jgi:membrane fusion protein, copper/silver efflux system
VEPGTTLYELADLSTVWIYADVYESQIAGVKLNQQAVATFDAYPGETFRGKVQYIYPYLTETTRTVRVRLELPNPKLKLKPGMYGNVLIQTDQKERLVIPKEAVLDTGVRQIVFLDKGKGMYVPTEVKLGSRSEDKVEVLAGLKEGDHVVTAANFLLDAQSKLASTGNMQHMMGQVGMADWQMRGAHEAKMDDMKDMKGMSGMSAPIATGPVSETRQSGGVSLTLTTLPEKPKAGENVLRLRLADKAGKAISNAQVVFIYTMPMPGMTDTKAPAIYKDGVYEGKAMLGMGGTWDVTVHITIPEKPPINEKFSLQVPS